LSAIDDAISLHIIKWNIKKLPRLEAKAWQKWQKAYRRGTRRDEIRQMQGQLSNLALRIPKMLNEIKKSNSTINGVRKAAGILEQTIFDREENNWHIALLKRKKTPGKPITAGVAKTNRRDIEDHVEGEEAIATKSGSESSDDDVGDFIASEDDIQMEASSVDSKSPYLRLFINEIFYSTFCSFNSYTSTYRRCRASYNPRWRCRKCGLFACLNKQPRPSTPKSSIF
jgi:hypothetical protein